MLSQFEGEFIYSFTDREVGGRSAFDVKISIKVIDDGLFVEIGYDDEIFKGEPSAVLENEFGLLITLEDGYDTRIITLVVTKHLDSLYAKYNVYFTRATGDFGFSSNLKRLV